MLLFLAALLYTSPALAAWGKNWSQMVWGVGALAAVPTCNRLLDWRALMRRDSGLRTCDASTSTGGSSLAESGPYTYNVPNDQQDDLCFYCAKPGHCPTMRLQVSASD